MTLRRRSRLVDVSATKFEESEENYRLEEFGEDLGSYNAIDARKEGSPVAGDLATSIRLLHETCLCNGTPLSPALLSPILSFFLSLVRGGDSQLLVFFFPQILNIYFNMLPAVDATMSRKIDMFEGFLIEVGIGSENVNLGLKIFWALVGELEESSTPTTVTPTSNTLSDDIDAEVLELVTDANKLNISQADTAATPTTTNNNQRPHLLCFLVEYLSAMEMLTGCFPNQNNDSFYSELKALAGLSADPGPAQKTIFAKLIRDVNKLRPNDGTADLRYRLCESRADRGKKQRVSRNQFGKHFTTQIFFLRNLTNLASNLFAVPVNSRKAEATKRLEAINERGYVVRAKQARKEGENEERSEENYCSSLRSSSHYG